MKLNVLSIRDVAERQLCCGCGACAYMSPDEVRMVDDVGLGRRPLIADRGDSRLEAAAAVCPGGSLVNPEPPGGTVPELRDAWGNVLECWEGFATDAEVRLAGSSGGAATALAMFAIEKGGMYGVLHTALRKDAPYLNATVLSTSREELVANTGSRYAPASPCDGLGMVEGAPGPSVFIGKPCDAAAAMRAAEAVPALGKKLGLTIAMFCAGTPSTRGTLELLKKVGVDDPSSVIDLRYRGNGWPGQWVVRFRAGDEVKVASLSYAESWDFLQRYRQWRCYICPDHTGELADIAVGDPWYRPIEAGEPGRSLIVARTRRGLEFLHAAAKAGYVTLEKKDASLLGASQPNLLDSRARLWAQLVVLRLCGAAVPRYVGFPTFKHWLRVFSLTDKVRSITSTAKRVFTKRLLKRVEVQEWKPERAKAEVS